MAILGDNVTTELSTDGGSTWNAVIGVKTLGSTGEEAPAIETTSLSDSSKQYLAGTPDGDEKEFTCNYEKDDAGQTSFRNAAKARSAVNMRITWRDGTKAEFSGVFLGFKMNEPNREEALTFTAKLRQNGTTTWTEPA